MSMAERWSVKLSVGESDDETHAEARLIMDGDDHLSGRGTARRNPADENVTKIGEEIAVARALSDLGHRLLRTAAADVEAMTHERARLHS
jgi:Rv2632c-like